jgi:hypothetical protein
MTTQTARQARFDQAHARMKSISEKLGIEYLGESPNHPIFKRGYTIVSGGYTSTSANGAGNSKVPSNSTATGTDWTGVECAEKAKRLVTNTCQKGKR